MSVFVLYGKDSFAGALPLYLNAPSGDSLPRDVRRFDAILQWGVPAKEPEGQYVLNPVKCLLRARHARSVRELWRLNGLRPAEGEERWVHEYQAAVFQQEVVGIWAKKRSPALVTASLADGSPAARRIKKKTAGSGLGLNGEYRELAAEEQQGFHVRRAKRDAVRAIYALGLSTGLVRLGVGSDGCSAVIEADPAPRLTGNDRLAELFAAAVNRYADELEQAALAEPYGRASLHPGTEPGREVREGRGEVQAEAAGGSSYPVGRSGAYGRQMLLGADPEFVLRRPGGGFVSASRFLEKEGRVGYDAVVLSRSRVIHPLAELRPRPCPDPEGLVRELHRTMRQAARLITDTSLQWLAGSMPGKGLPIGGHVHVSGIWLNERLLRALDNYVALPLVLAEGQAAGRRRPRYGFLGDCRRKRHGGFEYRPLPSWLATPELAYGVAALVRIVALEYRRLPRRPLDSADVQRAYYNGDKAQLLPTVMKLWPDLEGLASYGEHRKELDALRDRLFRLEGWDEQADIREAWGIPPYRAGVL